MEEEPNIMMGMNEPNFLIGLCNKNSGYLVKQ